LDAVGSVVADGLELVTFVEKALLLKSLPVFGRASPDQIATILDRTRERAFTPGASLFREGESPETIFFLLEGRAQLEEGNHTFELGPHDVVGLLPAIARRSHSASCHAETAVQALTLRVDAFLEILEDFFDLTCALLAHLSARLIAADPHQLGARAFAGEGPPFLDDVRPIQLIEKIVFMKSVRLLAGASAEELSRIGRESDAVSFRSGEEVFRAGDPADAFYLMLQGRLAQHGPRSSVGAIDVLGQGRYAHSVRAEEASYCLRVPAERFFDLLEDHFDLASLIARDLSECVRACSAEAEAIRPDRPI
jgi:CRP-like cAMP-binding protein